MSTPVTLIGNLAADPELRFTASGKAVAKFTVMTSRRVKTDTGWEDADVTGWPCAAFDRLAENIAESLLKGDPVIVSGEAALRSWDKDGEKRSRTEITAKEVSVSLRRFPVTPNRAERARPSNPVDDHWMSPPPLGEVPF